MAKKQVSKPLYIPLNEPITHAVVEFLSPDELDERWQQMIDAVSVALDAKLLRWIDPPEVVIQPPYFVDGENDD